MLCAIKWSPTSADQLFQRTARDKPRNFDALTYYTALQDLLEAEDVLKSVDSEEVAIFLALDHCS